MADTVAYFSVAIEADIQVKFQARILNDFQSTLVIPTWKGEWKNNNVLDSIWSALYMFMFIYVNFQAKIEENWWRLTSQFQFVPNNCHVHKTCTKKGGTIYI